MIIVLLGVIMSNFLRGEMLFLRHIADAVCAHNFPFSRRHYDWQDIDDASAKCVNVDCFIYLFNAIHWPIALSKLFNLFPWDPKTWTETNFFPIIALSISEGWRGDKVNIIILQKHVEEVANPGLIVTIDDFPTQERVFTSSSSFIETWRKQKLSSTLWAVTFCQYGKELLLLGSLWDTRSFSFFYLSILFGSECKSYKKYLTNKFPISFSLWLFNGRFRIWTNPVSFLECEPI